MNKKRLFGGALVAAGLVHGAANAQSFSFAYSSVSVGAYTYDGLGTPYFDAFAGAGPWSIFATDGVPVATSVGNASMIDLSAYSDGGSGAYARSLTVDFSVTGNAAATASWDFTGDAFGASGTFVIDNLTDAVNVLTVLGGTAAGSIVVNLEAGKNYRLTGLPFTTSGGTGTAFNNLLIPAPSSLALLGLGGLIATRRRR